jgi:hypothetical protein
MSRLAAVCLLAGATAALEVVRFGDGPIIDSRTPGWGGTASDNINGPCLVRVPAWVRNPLGRWYLYFAHHRGDRIRLAYADRPEGPWRIHGPGVIPLAASGYSDHVASPDIVIDEAQQRIICFYHGMDKGGGKQTTRAAVSADGLSFAAPTEPLAPFYLRVWRQDGWWYGLAKAKSGMQFQRSREPLSPWQAGPEVLAKSRHVAVLPTSRGLFVVASRIGDAPEALLWSLIDIAAADWSTWTATEPAPLLAPSRHWEGADLPVRPSRSGAASGRVHELRDPHLVRDGERLLLTYAVAGESGLALAELRGLPP